MSMSTTFNWSTVSTDEKIALLNEKLNAYHAIHGFDVPQTRINVTVKGFGKEVFPVILVNLSNMLIFRDSHGATRFAAPSQIRSIIVYGQ